MNIVTHRYSTIFATIMAACLFLSAASAQTQKRTILAGHVHPLATPEYDRGPLDPATKLTYMTLFVRRTAEQQSDLDGLIKQQLDLASPLFHRWLTPEQFAERFGARQEALDRLTAWLQSSGFSDLKVSRGRDYIVFNGTAGQVEAAMQTQIHRYDLNGEVHFANREAPSVPEDLGPLVAGFRGLNDFTPKPFYRRGAGRPIKMAGTPPRPQFYEADFPGVNILAPDDLAAIYNINALYRSGIDGSGQSIAIAGASDINMGDIESFRALFGLPFNDPQKILVPGSDDPGFNDADAMGEADLDLEWSGAVARNATFFYVYSTDAFLSALYAIDQALAPVLSYSFGGCELRATQSEVAMLMAEAEKAVVEGITWIAASGDAGAAGCESQNAGFTSAITRMNPNLPASLPYVTGVGGSEFNEGSGAYWSNTLGPNGGSTLGYIPEGGWTDESFIIANDLNGFASSGGGASWLFSKPAWQSDPGVPNDNARDVPDVAVTASWYHDAYALITAGSFMPSGGTSAAAPVFAGMTSLINQYLNQHGAQRSNGLGLINPTLYSLAGSAPAAFHDITRGSNIVPCVPQSTQDCTSGFMGYRAGPGYDQVTGLGSVDAYALALSWRAAISKTALLTVTQFTASTAARIGGAFNVSLRVANTGDLDAAAFEVRMLFTSDGTQATANDYSVFCDAKGLAAGATFTCSGTVNLGPSITPGVYLLLGIADFNQAIPQADRSGNAALASSGPLTVSR
jgi:subtilase family serine protease